MDILMDNPFSCACLYSPCVRSVLLERGECGSVTSQRPMRAVWCVRGRRCAVACTWSRVHPIGGHPEPRNRSYNSVVRGRVTVPVRERECRRVCGGICISHDVLRTSTWDQVADRAHRLKIAGCPKAESCDTQRISNPLIRSARRRKLPARDLYRTGIRPAGPPRAAGPRTV